MQLIHGLVDRVMEVIGTPFVQPGDNAGYYIERANVSLISFVPCFLNDLGMYIMSSCCRDND